MTKAKKAMRLSPRKLDKLPDRTGANPPEGPRLGAEFWKKAKVVRQKPRAGGSAT
jgi:hypothetical protein